MNFIDSFAKYHKFVIVFGLVLALFSLIDKNLAVGAIFVSFLFSSTLFFISKINPVRGQGILGEIEKIQTSNGVKEKETVTPVVERRAFTTGREFLSLLFFIVFLLVCQVGRSKKEGFIVGLIAGFYPSLAFYGSLLLKDALVVLVTMIGLLLTLKIIKKFSWPSFLIFYLVLISVIHLRFYLGYILILNFITFWFIFSDLGVKKRIIYGIIMIVLFGFLPRFAPLDGATQGYMGIKAVRSFLNPQTIISYRQLANPRYYQSEITQENQEAQETQETLPSIGYKSPVAQDSSILIDAGFSSPILFFKNNSLSFIYSVLGPLPWQLTKKKHLFILPEMILWYFLLFFIIKGVIKSIKTNYKTILPLIFFSLMIFGILSLYINNFGMITRIRMPAFLALLCLLPFGLSSQIFIRKTWEGKEKFTQLNNFWQDQKLKFQRILFSSKRRR